MYKQLPDRINFAELEQEILEFWQKNGIFGKSISSREGAKSFTFYEGPPTANGKPGIHHVLSRTIKDLVCRYKTLTGYQVYRKAGWDTQGLPVEIEVEKRLGFKHKEDILKFGVEKFNAECRNSVFTYLKDWEELTRRMGYWVNLDEAYVTYKNEYIESVWWSLKKFFEGGKIYKGHKIQPYCPRCETPLSTHEVAQGYEDVKDPSVYVKFKIKDGQGYDGYKFLVWTTTPWTLISNVALAVGPKISYYKVQLKDEESTKLILAKERLAALKDEYEIQGVILGSTLEHIEYEQLFDYVYVKERSFFVTLGDFVTTEDGSGIVHIAPAFGEDDYQLSRKYNLPVLQPVNKSGEFTDEVTDFAGRFVKEADDDIILKLKADGKLYRKEKFTHSYPHCWRCHTPLLYYALDSWYIATSSYKDAMIKQNNEINWYPPETGSGRFGNWLEENRDWALSRNRYWGTPLPIWDCGNLKCDNRIAIGSIEELKSSAKNFSEVYPDEAKLDLHKPFIDRIKIKCDKCGEDMNRTEEVIDAWYDSGSMPFAQHHYPFENKELFEKNYPADFIAEGVDQTRGWFYTLHAIGTYVFGEKAYKNLIVNDLILDKNGVKMSKHIGNVVNPFEIMDKYGADITRWYLMVSSPPWRPKAFNEDDLAEVRNKFFDTLVNTFKFFVLYSNLSGIKIEKDYKRAAYKDRPEIDRWIISAMNTLKKNYTELMDGYDITKAARMISDFTIDDLSNWYIRRNRRRFRNPADENDRQSAYQTLFEVLRELLKLIAPISPFLSDELYRTLTGEESVHLALLGEVDESEIDSKLEKEMHTAQMIVYLVRAIRVKNNLKTRQPLRQVLIPVMSKDEKKSIERMSKIILEEVNVKELNLVGEDSGIINKKAKANFKLLGPKYGKDMKAVAEAIKNLDHKTITKIEKDGSADVGGFKIQKEDIEVMTENIEGWLIESEGNLTVALDTKVDEELLNEGYAREFVSKIQILRREQGFGVNDKVKINYDCPAELDNAIDMQKKYIADETFAIEMNKVSGDKLNGFQEVNINGIDCRIYIEKVPQ